MQYAERLPSLPSPQTLVAPVVALALGAAVATGAYALIDNEQVVDEPSSKVIVLDAPAAPSEGVSAKNEAGTAAAISSIPAPSEGVAAKDEAATAAAIGTLAAPSEGVSAKDEAATAAAISALELRGSKASQTGTSGSPSTGESTAQPNDGDPLSAHQPRRLPAP